jgi:outer membrane protein TolC
MMRTGTLALISLCLLTAGGLAATDAVAAEPLNLGAALQRAEASNPGLQAASEGVVQARIARDRAWALIQPQVSLGALYRINDREIVLDFEDSLGGLGDAFGSIFDNLGLIYGELFEAGMIDATDCEAIAKANGFENCQAMTDALMGGGDIEPATTDSDSEPLVIQPGQQLFLSADLQWPLSPRVIPLARVGREQVRMAEAQIDQARDQILSGVVDA